MIKKSVIGIVLSPDHTKVLLIKRRDVPVWVLPGGGIDPGETPEKAAIREIKEESGIDAQIKRQTALYTPMNLLTNPTYVYLCYPLSHELSTGAESLEVGFFPIQALPESIFFLHREWLMEALTAKEILHKPIHQITYSAFVKYFFQHPVQVIRLLLSRLNIPFNS